MSHPTIGLRLVKVFTFGVLITATSLLLAQKSKPLTFDFSMTTTYRWLNKEVHGSRLLDDMEDLATWSLENTEQAEGKITIATSPIHSGEASLRLECPTNGKTPIPQERYFGFARVRRIVAIENWENWNRISFWVYPDMPGHKNISLLTILHNDGSQKVPDHYGKMGLNYVLLRNREWNHVVWEIANLARDRVTAFEFQYRMQGHEPGAAEQAVLYFDQLELEQVDADHFEGWSVAPGQIAFSHIGYLPGLSKTAFASALDVPVFHIVDQASGQTAFRGPVKLIETVNGTFALLDFTELRTPGKYVIRAGDRSTAPFRIGPDVWEDTVSAILNFFYAERCGTAIPGIHDVCHRDWLGKRGDQTIILNGGWHDAGDLSQGLKNTAQATQAMFALAERLTENGRNHRLADHLITEARWGLDWVLKNRFPDGSRVTWATHDRWTNGIIGDTDDMEANAYPSASGSFMAAAAEAVAARVLEKVDPEIAELSRQTALKDWNDGLRFLESGRRPADDLELVSLQGIAALELFQTFRQERFAETAISLAAKILVCQETVVPEGLEFPITGFFYSGPDRTRILRYEHSSEQQAPLTVLTRLCELFPEHPDWMKWYTAVTLYSRYYVQEMAQFSSPYNMLASALHRDDDHTRIEEERIFPGATAEEYKAQVLAGVKIGPHHYVRRFPVWFVFRGNSGTLLSETLGLAQAARLRQDSDGISLVQEQLMWVTGRNPFGQSTIFGVGYDYPPQYAAMFGDQVGATAVGIQTRHERDVPYWPAENCHNWKETWVHPAVRWLEILRFLETPVKPGPAEKVQEAFPIVDTVQSPPHDGRIEFEVSVRGKGSYQLKALSANLDLDRDSVTLTLDEEESRPVRLGGTVRNPRSPWLLLIVPNGETSRKIELTGYSERSME